MIPLSECKHGYLYRIRSRNLGMGVFNEKTKGFVGIRTKFESRYLFTEYHWDTGAPFGTVTPIEIVEECPVKDLRCHLGTYCINCKVDVEFVQDNPDGVRGHHKHLAETECKKVNPVLRNNKELFNYLNEKRNG